MGTGTSLRSCLISTRKSSLFSAGRHNEIGLCFQPAEQSVESYIYTPRIQCPTIMLNGKYDVFFPLKTSQIPMFTLMGTPEEDKKHYIYSSGHYVPRKKMIEEHLGWLELYLD